MFFLVLFIGLCAVSAGEDEVHEPAQVCPHLVHDLSKGEITWTNPSWPQSDSEPLDCRLTIKRAKKDTCYGKFVFQSFRTVQPTQGRCLTDKLSLTNAASTVDFCGEEPDLAVEHPEQFEGMLYHELVKFDKDEVDVRLTTTTTIAGRRWQIRVVGIDCDKRYEGCNYYALREDEKTSITWGTFNFPHSLVNGLIFKGEDVSCFGQICKGCDVKIITKVQKSLELVPSKEELSKVLTKTFSFDASNGDFSRHNCECKKTYIELLDRTNGKNKRFCGGNFNSKSHKNTDSSVVFRTSKDVLRIRIPKIDTFSKDGVRFTAKSTH